ncbi:MAG: imidazolonepropionase [Cyanobacteria bacterium TGS_CYA1]|nr:imidazolonepropionase [Cyanobacteria bacterium TGS_CYA1]
MNMHEPDLVIENIGELVSPPFIHGPHRGHDMGRLTRINDGAIACVGGRIVACGEQSEVSKQIKKTDKTKTVSAKGKLVTPGLIDPHTHLVFSGNRAAEFLMRCQGKTYAEIAKAGGGIVASTTATRQATSDELEELGLKRLSMMLQYGTTSAEAKTGYGLSHESELMMLETILKLHQNQPLELTPTFMPAHAVPKEMKKAEYVDVIIRDMLPAAAELLRKYGWLDSQKAYSDVFCDEGYFTLDDTRRIFERSAELGMSLRVHADEFVSLGAVRLACDLGASSVDHLLAIKQEDIRCLSESNTVAVLLPGTSFFLNLEKHAPARILIDEGACVALGSDFNPGSCHIFSLPMIFGLACMKLKMTAEEALTAMTANAAYAIGRGEDIGRLYSGYQADIIIWDLGALEEIPYKMVWNPILRVFKKGVEV